MKLFVLLALSLAATIVSAGDDDDDGLTTGNGTPGDSKYKDYCAITDEIKEQLTKVHNEIRQKVASGNAGLSPAKCMYKMTWNDDVAADAQEWADQGRFKHDSDRHREKVINGQKVPMGQCLGMAEVTTPKVDYVQAINQMYNDEIGNITANPDLITNYKFDKPYGHASQLLWGQTDYFGCGGGVTTDDNRNTCFLACNYAPPGNYDNYPMYIAGDATDASDCIKGRSSEYSALCETAGYLMLPSNDITKCAKASEIVAAGAGGSSDGSNGGGSSDGSNGGGSSDGSNGGTDGNTNAATDNSGGTDTSGNTDTSGGQ